jgi:hypothetical protein
MKSRSYPRRTIRPLDFRHGDENSVTASPLASTLTNRDARNSFRPLRLRAFSARRIRFYENCRVSLEFTAKISEESGLILSIFSVLKLFEKCALPKPFQFRALRTLSFSVACKSFACHSYENNRGVAQLFPKWNYFTTPPGFSPLNPSHPSPFTSHLLRLTPSPSADSINSHPAERHFHFAVPPSGGGIP